jgi:hypothetical protein
MGRVLRRGPVLTAVLMIWAVSLAGCGMVTHSYKAVAEKSHQALRWYKSPGDDLVKKVGVAWLVNRSGYTAVDFQDAYTTRLADRLRGETAGLKVVGPADPAAPDLLNRLPLTPEGRIDNLELALLAQQAGLNAVVVPSLIDVRDRRQEKGVWWFKDVYDYIEVTINVEVYDSQTAAKLLDERFTREFEADIPMVMPNQPAATVLPPQVLDEIEAMLKPIARRIADAVVIQPWVGFIREVSGEKVTLTADADTGLEAGDVLEVFDNRRVIQGMENVHFFVPGLKIGEIEVTAAAGAQVEARILSGAAVWAGCPVKLKAD